MQVGAPIPVSFQLYDCANDQFVRAWVRKPDGSLVGGAPVDLTLVALGLYQNFTLDMPDEPFVTVQYVVYSDSGYTVISGNEGAGSETFVRDPASGVASPFVCFLTGVVDGEIPCAPNGLQDTIIRGAKRLLTIQLQRAESQQPLDLSDYELITCRFLKSDRTVLEVTSDDSNTPIAVTNAGGGTFTLSLTSEQTAELMPQNPAAFTVLVEFPDGTVMCNFPFQLSVQDQAV